MKPNFALSWKSKSMVRPLAAKKSWTPWENLFDNLFLFCGVHDCWPVPSVEEILAGEES